MRRSLCLLFLLPVFACAQRTYKPEEVNRLADLGRLWGILHYFHPAMADGSITTESLVVDNAASLANDPSAENFRRVVGDMLGKLKDPAMRIVEDPGNVSYNIFSKHPDSVTIHKLNNDVVYIACPTSSEKNSNLFQNKELSVAELSKSKGVIFDFRNRSLSKDPTNDWGFIQKFVQKYLGSITKENELKVVFNTFIQHNGFIPQQFFFNEYTSGWRSESTFSPIAVNFSTQKLNAPLMFIVNQSNNLALIKLLRSLQAAGKALLIYEGNKYDKMSDMSEIVSLTDNVRVIVKTGYQVIDTGYLLPAPDTIINYIPTDYSFMNHWSEFLISNKPTLHNKVHFGMKYKLPLPSVTNTLFASVGERLFGLYNYWNAINYFFPSKHMIGRSWDSIWNEYIPRFVNATDTFSYFRVIKSLASEINDSHAFTIPVGNYGPIFERFYHNPLLVTYKIENRLFVLDIGNDIGDLKKIKIWDEIIKIDDVPVMQYVKKFRKFYYSSNEEAFYHNVFKNMVLDGPKNSVVKITLKRREKMFDVRLTRTVINTPGLSDSFANLSQKHSVSEILPGNIGYVNKGKLTIELVDSVMKLMWNTKAIIFDSRNAPQNVGFVISPYLTDKIVNTHLSTKKIVDYRAISQFGAKDITSSEMSFVMPRTDGLLYKGKVIVLCDNNSQSHSEYSTMMIAEASKGIVIGSQTAGADGAIADVYFPGGYTSFFSATGIYYPNGKETQRIGVKIDIQCKPTLKGLQAGRDEVLERAIRFINTGK